MVTVTPRLKKMLGWLVAATAAGFFVHRLIANLGTMPHLAWNATTCVTGVASILLATLAIVLSGAIWQVLLRDQGIRMPWRRVVSLYLVAQFGKYLPGNVGQYVGRAVLGAKIGIPVPVTLTTMVIEALWGIGTAVGLSALSLYLFLDSARTALPDWVSATGFLLCFVGLLVAPWLGISLAKRLTPRLIARVFGAHDVKPPAWLAALKVSLLYVACSLCMGLIVQWQSIYLFAAVQTPLLQVSGFFALAWLAGYLLPGAPAGLGVREFMMALLFTPIFGEGTALALGVTLRVATTLADALAFITGSGWRFSMSTRR
jgi:uncharacterized membrane protein YbhN (UPF0104 family)